jgi:protein TonB
MSPTAKDLDVPESNSAPSGAGKAQPVALEVPVTVNGARTVGNSDKREPFSETTQTVLVFGNGAVIRLASTVAPGQLLFLTNEKTKKEVVCQVLKSKNYSNVSGYVELEFTEAVSGFWGIRFPEAPVKASAPAPAAPTAVKPAAPPAPQATAPKPQTPVVSTAPKPPIPVAPSAPRIEVKAPASAAPPKAPAAPVLTTSRAPEVKPPAPVVPTTSVPAAPVNTQTQSSSDALRRESARLQEQLSAMQFSSQAPATNKPASSDSIPKVIEMARPQAPATRAVPPTKAPSNLEAEEVKVPSWLEPLARNAATPSHNEALAEEEPVEAEQVIEYEVQDAEPAATHQMSLVTPPEPALDVQPIGRGYSQERAAAAPAAGGNKMILIGAVAAGFLILGIGGTLLLRRSPSPAVQTASASVVPGGTAAVQPTTNAPSPAASSANTSSSVGNSAPVAAPPAASQSITPTAQPLKAASSKNAAAELSAYKKLAEPQPQPAVQPPSKKPGLGQVHLAAPAAARRSNTTDAAPADLAPSLSGGQIAPVGGDSLGGGFAAAGAKQPVAPPKPLPVGGEVKQAKLISSTPPTYPTLAKTQHIEGNVRVDALVDENGRVSSVKVVSGPTLLHQAAMDAIRQWKYQPATLDGKAVPMHLTVTLQFRLQ